MLMVFLSVIDAQDPDAVITVPKNYETWSVVQSCAVAQILYYSAKAGDDETIEREARESNRAWYSYSGSKEVEILKRDVHCALVRIKATREEGYISMDLVGSSTEELARKAKRIKAEEERNAAKLKVAQKAEQERQAIVASLPILDNGAETIFIGSDKRCAEQFIEATKMEGLEKRKRLADLMTYGCGFITTARVHVAVETRAGAFALVRIAHGSNEGKSGWVSVTWIK